MKIRNPRKRRILEQGEDETSEQEELNGVTAEDIKLLQRERQRRKVRRLKCMNRPVIWLGMLLNQRAVLQRKRETAHACV